ncbi:MAG: ABC transporter substrate-binding protein [Lachnospiraceae bacterium]|nr:ABC transporter substrate-binding protein [Lachnospiraceae bacterium]
MIKKYKIKNVMKTMLCLTVLLVLSIGLTACGGTKENPALESTEADTERGVAKETEITDLIGRTLTVTPGSFQRIVCIGAGALRMYTYIGDIGLLCGVEDIDNESLTNRPKMFDSVARPYVMAYGEIFETLPSCGVGGPNAQTAEAEKILSCNPDLVISEYEDVEKANALQEQLGIPVVTLKTGPDGVFDPAFRDSMTLLGMLLGKEKRAAELVSFVELEKTEISERTADIKEEEKPSAYICGLGNWGTTNHLMTSERYASFNVAHIKNVVTGLGTPGVSPIEEEKFISLGSNMDIMFIDAAAVKNIQPLYQEDRSMFDTVKAWKNGEVYLQMAYNAYYTNYEIALANTWFLAKNVYPEQFADIDITEKLNEITEMFLGQKLAEEIFSCPASFGGYQKIKTETFFN